MFVSYCFRKRICAAYRGRGEPRNLEATKTEVKSQKRQAGSMPAFPIEDAWIIFELEALFKSYLQMMQNLCGCLFSSRGRWKAECLQKVGRNAKWDNIEQHFLVFSWLTLQGNACDILNSLLSIIYLLTCFNSVVSSQEVIFRNLSSGWVSYTRIFPLHA